MENSSYRRREGSWDGGSLENFNEDIQKLVPQMLELRLSAAWDFSIGVSPIFCLSLHPYIRSPPAEMSFLEEARQGGSQELWEAAIALGFPTALCALSFQGGILVGPALGHTSIYLWHQYWDRPVLARWGCGLFDS